MPAARAPRLSLSKARNQGQAGASSLLPKLHGELSGLALDRQVREQVCLQESSPAWPPAQRANILQLADCRREPVRSAQRATELPDRANSAPVPGAATALPASRRWPGALHQLHLENRSKLRPASGLSGTASANLCHGQRAHTLRPLPFEQSYCRG